MELTMDLFFSGQVQKHEAKIVVEVNTPKIEQTFQIDTTTQQKSNNIHAYIEKEYKDILFPR
jgi:hypothetical protein